MRAALVLARQQHDVVCAPKCDARLGEVGEGNVFREHRLAISVFAGELGGPTVHGEFPNLEGFGLNSHLVALQFSLREGSSPEGPRRSEARLSE